MTYFTCEDHQTMANAGVGARSDFGLQHVYNKFTELNNALHRRLRDHNCDLHPHADGSTPHYGRSVTSSASTESLALPYLRSREQAQLVERLMGRDNADWRSGVDVFRHPVIEVRLTPRYFTIELVLSPAALWDQQNFVGKLVLPRHRESFRAILRRMSGDYCFGFWDGVDLGDMYLTTQQLIHGNNLDEWMSTFCDGQDWLRIGVWYEPGDPSLDASRILAELGSRVTTLYSIYNFLLWTSNNDFHSFYQKIGTRSTELRML